MPCGRWRAAASPMARMLRSKRCAGPEILSRTGLPRTSTCQSGVLKVALAKRTCTCSSSHALKAPIPRKKGPPPQDPLIMLKPVVYSFSSEDQKEASTLFLFMPPTSAARCTSVMKEPSTMSVPP